MFLEINSLNITDTQKGEQGGNEDSELPDLDGRGWRYYSLPVVRVVKAVALCRNLAGMSRFVGLCALFGIRMQYITVEV